MGPRSMSESANDRVGELVDGRYRLLALVGRGGMADVYRARDEVLGRTVAVKMMRAEAGVEVEDALRRHEMEAKIGAGVSHPGVVTVFDVQPSSDNPYLVMEFVPGKTLSRVLVDGAMAPVVVADIGAQLGDALAAIHEAGVVHRDIKPSNAMLVEQGDGSYQVKLTDFGVSRYLEGTRLTSPDLLVGTARYLSPEQAVLDEVGPRADVYALGLVLLEALTGEEAFPGSRVETLSARLHRPPRIPAELGDGWALALGAMTRRDPDERPDAAGAAAALRAVRDGRDVAAVLTAAGVTVPDPEGDATVVGAPAVEDDPTIAAAVGGAGVAAAAGAAAGLAGAGAAQAAEPGTAPLDAVGPETETADAAADPATDPGDAAGAGDATEGAGAAAAAEPSPWAKRAPWIVVALVVVAAVAAVWLVLASVDDPERPTDDPTPTPTPTPSEVTPSATTEPTTTATSEPTETTPPTTDPTTAPTTTPPTTEPTTAPTTTPPTTEPTTAPTTTPPPTTQTPEPTDDGNALPPPPSDDPTDGP
ncbi:serine/threonine-protein kinase [Mumia sp. Pv 4-285]|uniref:serine/threonine-protein kinase n=1 Tax=Mumia qirimensis TaxID=3234852 RepID=UPI00351CDA87